jgi:hypothetical protein
MKNRARFDLEHALDEWRRETQQAGTVEDEQRVELENHLLESLAELQELGLSEEEAFLIARRRLGETSQIAHEFGVANALPAFTRPWKIAAWACFVFACFFFFLGCASLSYPGEQFHQRIAITRAVSSALEAGLRPGMMIWFPVSVFAAATALALFFKFARLRWVRLVIIAGCLMPVLAIILADVRSEFWISLLSYLVSLPMLTLRVLAGGGSGEYFQDSLVIGLAYGWWLVMWLGFGLRELVQWAAKAGRRVRGWCGTARW